MASIISAGTTDATSLNVSSDRTGILQLASNNATVAVTINTSQYVGIGDTNPQSSLAVNSTTNPQVRVAYTGVHTYGLKVSSGGNFSIQDTDASSTDRLTIDTSGNVGIGTSSPGSLFDVYKDSGTAYSSSNTIAMGQWARISNPNTVSGAGVSLMFRAAASSLATIACVSTAAAYSSALTFATRNSAGDISESMRIDSSGNVGIGVTSLATSTTPQLQIGAQTVLNNISNNTSLGNNASYNGGTWKYIATAASSLYQQTGGTHNWYAAASGTAGNSISYTVVMNTDSAGRVWIGNTASAGNTFRVYAVGSDNSVAFGTSGAGVYLPNGATSFSTYSDLRLKNVTGRYETPLQDIAKLNAIKFTWKNDTTNKPCVGVSAQSVQTAVPEAIDHSTTFNAEGDTTEYLTVRYAELVPLMIASIQELKAINDTQAETINALTARLEALENK
jgi:hypothetical protein